MIKITVGTMGGDFASGEMVVGAVETANARPRIRVLLVGQEQTVASELGRYTYNKDQIQIVNTAEVIATEEPPVNAIRKKRDSSIMIGMNLVKKGGAGAFVFAGSSGTVLVGGQVIMGRIKSMERPPLAPLIPTGKGVSFLIDCGVSVDARTSHLMQFAQMGSIYMEHMIGIRNPRVAVINIGAEEEKDNALVKETFPLLKECEGINFIGSIEARKIPHGAADVIVCETFVSSVILELYEGVGATLINMVKGRMMSTLRSKVGVLLVKPTLRQTLKAFDGSQCGGAPLLGLNGLVVKAHGNSKHTGVRNSIIQCVTFRGREINEKIQESLGTKGTG